MKFSYHDEPSMPSPAHPDRQSVFRPRIRVRLFHNDRFIDLLALVDSGADDCLFPMEVATELNLPLDSQKANLYGGIGAGHISATFTHVRLNVAGDITFLSMPALATLQSVVPILGQAGFFDRFEVKFNRRKQFIDLKVINLRQDSFH